MNSRICSMSDLDIEIRDLVDRNYTVDQIFESLSQNYGIAFSSEKIREYVNSILCEDFFEKEY